MINRIQPDISFSGLKYKNNLSQSTLAKITSDDKLKTPILEALNTIDKLSGDEDVILTASDMSGYMDRSQYYVFSIYNKKGRILTSTFASGNTEIPKSLKTMAEELKCKLTEKEEDKIIDRYNNDPKKTSGLKITDETTKDCLKALMTSNISLVTISNALQKLNEQATVREIFLTVKKIENKNNSQKSTDGYQLTLQDKNNSDIAKYLIKTVDLSDTEKQNQEVIYDAFDNLSRRLSVNNIIYALKILDNYSITSNKTGLKLNKYLDTQLSTKMGFDATAMKIISDGLNELNQKAIKKGENIYLSQESIMSKKDRIDKLTLRDNCGNIIASDYMERLNNNNDLKGVFSLFNKRLEKYIQIEDK